MKAVRQAKCIAWMRRYIIVTTLTAGGCWGAGEGSAVAQSVAAAMDRPASTGSLVICGGGEIPGEIRAAFWRLAGGKQAKIVVIPTASESADRPEAIESLDPWTALGASSVMLLHTRSRIRADERSFVQPLDEATGVWFGGGDQSRITAAYLGTAVESATRAVLDRGGVIGGTSAGAAIMSRVMITGGKAKAEIGVGLGFLPGVVIEQHALKRNRINRLLGVLLDHPELTGLAIDESTALVVRPDHWQVLGRSYVVACRPANAAGLAPSFHIFKGGDQGKVPIWSVGR